MKPQFPGILHSSRFRPILEVNNGPYSNPGYLILILSTSLFNTDVIYNAILLSTKELHLSIKTDRTNFWEWEQISRQFEVTKNNGGAVPESPASDGSWGFDGISQPRQTLFCSSVFSEQEDSQTESWITPPGKRKEDKFWQSFKFCFDENWIQPWI